MAVGGASTVCASVSRRASLEIILGMYQVCDYTVDCGGGGGGIDVGDVGGNDDGVDCDVGDGGIDGIDGDDGNTDNDGGDGDDDDDGGGDGVSSYYHYP